MTDRLARRSGVAASALAAALPVALLAAPALAQTGAAAPAPEISAGDTAWMLMSTALVLMMTLPGLALFYGGMVRKKNVLATLAQSLGAAALCSVLWVLVGYSLVFTEGSDWIGDFSKVMLAGLALDSVHANAKTIPESVFMMYQLTFAVITPALVLGAVADRVKFSAALWFMGLWLLIVYCPIAHWVWGGGWAAKMGVLDFAGGIVVHINAGVAGLVAAVYMGPRRGWRQENMAPHNLVLSVIGVALLWVGWFGFNAGSAVAADGRAGFAMGATHIAACAAALSWIAFEWKIAGKPSVLGLVSGVVAGLGTITPAAGYVGIGHGMIIGLVAGGVCYWACTSLKRQMGYDDSLDVFGVHGVGGFIGTIAAGVFASSAIAGPEISGLMEGNGRQVLIQIVGAAAATAWCAVLTAAILKALDVTIGLRVADDEEVEGLDIRQHGEVVQ